MVLGFSKTNRFTDEKTCFQEKILAGTKIHTLRQGRRWKPGMSIQMATGARTRNYNQFNSDRPDLAVCKSVQEISISIPSEYFNDIVITIDGKELGTTEMISLACNDGFDNLIEFFQWFVKSENMPNQIVHWTDFRY